MRLTRRDAFAGAAGAVVVGAATRLDSTARSAAAEPGRAYHGRWQAGIVTPRQAHLTLAAFELVTPDRADVPRLLADWTALTRTLCERPAHGLTVTVGLGSGLFDERYGWRARRPAGLEQGGNGDLLLQVCADDRHVVFEAVRQLGNAALGIARRTWTQHGFAAARNVAGFRDGAVNPAGDELARHVWVASGADRPGMVDGTYLVYRRIRMRLQAWDRSPVAEQEHAIGRRKASGEPLSSAAPWSHVRAMRPEANGGVRILRRSYNFDDGSIADGETDAGLAFIAFTADPKHGCGRLLDRFERADELRDYATNTAGAVFAMPPAPAPGEYVGERLLG